MSEVFRKSAWFLINAGKGDVRAARSLVSRAIRGVLGNIEQRTEPYIWNYVSVSEMNGYRDSGDTSPQLSRYNINVTEEEYFAITEAILILAKQGGWSQPPVDAYYD